MKILLSVIVIVLTSGSLVSCSDNSSSSNSTHSNKKSASWVKNTCQNELIEEHMQNVISKCETEICIKKEVKRLTNDCWAKYGY